MPVLSSSRARIPITWTIVLPRHCSTCRCPFIAAYAHVTSSHVQSCSRAQRSTSKCPLSAAHAHVHSFHGQPCCRAHCSRPRWAASCTFEQTLCPASPPAAHMRLLHQCPSNPSSFAKMRTRTSRHSPSSDRFAHEGRTGKQDERAWVAFQERCQTLPLTSHERNCPFAPFILLLC